MKRLSFFLLTLIGLLWPIAGSAQRNPFDHRGAQFATQGTDFWCAVPRSRGANGNYYCQLYVVAERDCDVTISCPGFSYSETFHAKGRVMAGPDTNYFEIPYPISYITDSLTPNASMANQAVARPLPYGLHVTSTDTIALFAHQYSFGSTDAANIFPTELLRDDYVVQTFPRNLDAYLSSFNTSIFYVIATEDSTTVDIIFSEKDWLGHLPGDTVTLLMNAGDLYFVGTDENDTNAINMFQTHAFTPNIFNLAGVYYPSDISGTRIISHDCKRIAVFEGGQDGCIPFDYTGVPVVWGNGDYHLEQSLPTCFAGTQFLVPNIEYSDTDYIRFTGLHDNTTITITDASRLTGTTRTISVNAYETNWFEMHIGEGPFFISATHPVLVKDYAMGSNSYRWMLDAHDWGDPAAVSIRPVEWWHEGQANYATITYVDPDHNRTSRRNYLHLFTRTADINGMYIDDIPVRGQFQPVHGSQFSYAYFDRYSQYVSEGTHHIESRTGAPFYAFLDGCGKWEHLLTNVSHVQPSNCYLTAQNIYSDSLKPDSIWCMYDPIRFHAWHERPADSVIWDFGDGTVRRYSHLDTVHFERPFSYTYSDTGRYTVRVIFTFADEGCYTLNSDTLYAPIWIHNHYDSAFSVRLCEGSYTFRGCLLDYTDTHYITTYWTPSGCDTLWQIDLVTCPHCSYWNDTIAPDQLPWTFNGHTFNSETHGAHVHISPTVPDTNGCDSIITYSLIIIRHWGETPVDSTFILAPNIFMPNTGGDNSLFKLYCSPDIQQAKVSVYNRMGERITQFDGLTGSWDGSSSHGPCPQGAYLFYVRYIDLKDNNWKTFTGTVTLIR